ncbi:antA/AntB antirepressor family protein [Clostridium botulinum]|uniref:antA/AntB antirepressor family protein n=1 Tax=Clostridium botulinum TaxID=1491 RepID=UPI001C9B9E78|nr:antA/AntB antirepressor family protein [Clostridium botulinum]MBY6842773.1 antA/AntB antirepressor family protein [Clostridium botulinum]
MKSFTKTINGKKYKGKAFEKSDIVNKFNRTEKEWELIDRYQKIFPQLLINDTDNFVIDGEILCRELSVKDHFTKWLLENRRDEKGRIKSQGKLIKYKCVENKDYQLGELPTEVKGTPKKIITLTLNCAKKIAMRQNNNNGDLVCDYFILMENILKDYETWMLIREPEKQGFNKMKKYISEWCKKRGYDNSNNYFYIREANLLNESLTGLRAIDIRIKKQVEDNQTRNNLDYKVNNILATLQEINISLLIADMDFDKRKEIIENTCSSQYSYIKELFNNTK